MRFLWLLFAVGVVAQLDDYVEEEELEEPYNEDDYEHSRSRRDVHDYEHARGTDDYRTRRDVHDESPYEEHIRVKRCMYEDVPLSRVRRSEEYVRVPRQVHQYEVHEFTDEGYPAAPPYEEMLAASAEHYHKVYAAPNSRPDVSGPVVYRPVPSVLSNQLPVQAQRPVHHQPLSASAQSRPVHHQPISVQSQPQPVQYRQILVPVKASIQVADAPHSYKSPLGIVQAPVGAVPIPVAPVPVGTVPIATVEAVPLLSDQQEAAAVVKHNKQGTRHKQGGGHGKHVQHDAHRGGKTSKGFKHDHHVDKGATGHKTDELHRKEYEEAQGKQKKHHDHADHKGSHEEQAHGHKGSKFDEKKGHKKGHKTKGYHNKYHKDEFHKEHKFYDDYHKSGEHHRFGKFNAKHASNESGKKKAHHVNAGHDFVERGKKGYSNKGHLDADHKGYNGKQGHEEHHEKHSSHGKKGGKEGGSQWKHSKKN